MQPVRYRRWLVGAACLVWLSPVSGQQLIERVVARVNGYAITLTDVRAAIALGVVDAPTGANQEAVAIEGLINRQLMLAEVARFAPPEPESAAIASEAAIALGVVDAPTGANQEVAIEGLINRQLMLAEVARFAPPEPESAAIASEAAARTARAGPGLAAVMASTGLDQARIRDIARDTLRIQAYLDQRFGTTVQLTEEEITQYYRNRPDEFTRNGTLSPFTEVESLVRERAAAQRRAATVAQWVRDLRMRADISVPKG